MDSFHRISKDGYLNVDRPELSVESRAGWGMAHRSTCTVLRPHSVTELQTFLNKNADQTILCWGNGRSYGDAALNQNGIVLDLSGWTRVLAWDTESGVVIVEPGVTISQLWKHCLADGYWPPVVSGTQTTTLGGCVSANAHGKNNWKYGPMGEHVLSLELMLADGQLLDVSPDVRPDLFHAVIGGFGLVGVITKIKLRMKRVYSGNLEVYATSCSDLAEMFDSFERYNAEDYDYVVGWMDAFPRGRAQGRGQIHAANYIEEGADPQGKTLLTPARQAPGTRVFGIIPRGWMWFFAKPWAHRLGMRSINLGRFLWAKWFGGRSSHYQPHAQFNFLLDFIPNWKKIYEPGGLIQYQVFLPKERAQQTMMAILSAQQERKLESWLVVMKRHRADAFWLSHALDGYSFAMDFPVTERNRTSLFSLTQEFEALVLEAGGRFYLAKDAVISSAAFRASLGDAVIEKFLALKRDVDPKCQFQGNAFRRVFGDRQ